MTDEDDSEDEVADKKLIQHLSSALQVVAMQLPTESSQCVQVSLETNSYFVLQCFQKSLNFFVSSVLQLLEKMRTLCSERSVKNISVVKTLVQLLLKLTMRCKAESQMLPNLTKQLQEEIGILPDIVSIFHKNILC